MLALFGRDGTDRRDCVGPLGESHDVPCIPRGLRDGMDSRDGAV